jgi:saccharopine dehydrogenase-like NADP-dependent oxidoreductase
VKRVLVLGAGLVSRPLVRHLLAFPDLAVTVADQDGSKASGVVDGHPRGTSVALGLEDEAAVSARIRESDLVVSLLPATLHVPVARIAIAHRRPVVTTSYVSAEMKALDGEARAAGVIVLNECGLDPGLDHMSAMRTIDRLRAEGHRLVSFRSCCGGLPAPEADTNPWGYKFSWSPRGVLLAGRSAARWLEDGSVVEVPGGEIFTRVAPYEVPGLGRLEVYPNRDSTAYVATYGIEGVQTMFRGTLRRPGWCATLDAVARLGLLDVGERAWRPGTTCREMTESLALGRELALRAPVRERLAWAGLFSDVPIGATRAAPLDVLCALLQARMGYAPGERDMVVLRHQFGAAGPDGTLREISSTLVAYGEPGGESAMARTVSLPAAIAARLILDGRMPLQGVRVPVHREIYEPVLEALESMGVRFEEEDAAAS